MTSLTDLQALCEKATAGPWRVLSVSSEMPLRDVYDIVDSDGVLVAQAYWRWPPDDVNIHPLRAQYSANNAAFIAASRTAVPALIKRVEELEAINNGFAHAMAATEAKLATVERETVEKCAKVVKELPFFWALGQSVGEYAVGYNTALERAETAISTLAPPVTTKEKP